MMAARRQHYVVQLGWGLCVSAALHAAVLGSLRPVQLDFDGRSPAATVSVRMVPAAAGHAVSPVTSSAESTPAEPALTRPRQGKVAPPSEEQAPAASPANPLFGVIAEFAPGEFHAADTLAHRPAPIGDIVVDYPAGPDAAGAVTVRLTLFIDELGSVVRIWADDPDAPERFVDAARAAFLGAKFAPGQLAEGPVKSRLRVEVRFDSGVRP